MVAAVLWSLALFDVVGRRVGALRAATVLVVTWTMPWWVTLVIDSTWWQHVVAILTSKTGDKTDQGDVELVVNPLAPDTSPP